ncbi:MAG: bifunctional RNase H/acid phosphatase [Frankiaceae bacterium]|nr:bifunctional RNase H/acid phosphatase [Frankiaceae bacterium]
MTGRRLIVEADGGSRGNPGPAGYGAVVRDALTGEVLAERAAGIGVASNNVAEYGGLIAGLRAALELDPAEVEVRMDSKLVVEQMSGRWQVKHPGLKPLAREASGLLSQLPQVRLSWIPREKNKHADRLANEAMDAAATGAAWKPDAAAVFLEKAAAAPNRLSGWQDPPAKPTTTLLLRHGQTALSIERRFSGVGDPPLTDVGRTQAAAAAVRLAGSGAVAVVSSPLRRARETALLVAEGLGIEVAVDEGLRETDFGDWEGFTFGEVREKWPREMDEWFASTDVAPPFGESFDATAARVRAARDRVLSSYGGKTVVVVSHVTPIKTLLRMALDAPPSSLYRMHLDLACLNDVRWHADGAAVVRSMNDVGHLST